MNEKESPLSVIQRCTRRCHDLFRKIGHPGWALFAEIAQESAVEAQHIAADAATADADACRMLDEVLADGVVTKAEVAKLREALRKVARSKSLDAHLAGVVV